MQLTILCTCLSLRLTRDLQNFRCALTLFVILQGKVSNILKLWGKYYTHLSGNLVSILTVEFL